MNKIKKYEIDNSHYFDYLMNLCSNQQKEHVYSSCLGLLSNQIKKFTLNESSSVSESRAKALLSSINFTLGVYLKSLNSDDYSLTRLQNENYSLLLQKGQELLKQKTINANKTYFLLCNNLLKIHNYAYNATIVNGLSSFFINYDIRFAADEKIITADYPTYFYPNNYNGIEFIERYVNNLFIENTFCSCFEINSINTLLRCYDNNYKDLIFNMFAQILLCCLTNVITKTDFKNLLPTKTNADRTVEYFSKLNDNDIYKVCFEISDKICSNLKFENNNIKHYINKSVIKISKEIIQCYKFNNTNYIFYYYTLT